MGLKNIFSYRRISVTGGSVRALFTYLTYKFDDFKMTRLNEVSLHRKSKGTFKVGDGNVVTRFGMPLVRGRLQPNVSLVFIFVDTFALEERQKERQAESETDKKYSLK